MSAYRKLTVSQVTDAVRSILQEETDESVVKSRIKKELEYDGTDILINSHTVDSGPYKMTMFMVMMEGPDGKVLNI